MKLVALVLAVFLFVGCQKQAEVEESVEEPDQTAPQSELDRKPEQVSEETIVGEIQKTPEEPTMNPVISLEEAKMITKENLAKSIELMQNLQEDHQEWMGVDDQSEYYKNGVEATKNQLKGQLAESDLDQWAETYFEEFFIYNHLYNVLHPGGMNTRFELKEFTENQFTLSYIQLGDEVFTQTTKYDVSFLKENDEWVFEGYRSEENLDSLDLTEKDLSSAFINYETMERVEGKLLDEIVYEGETFLIMEYEGIKRVINSQTGEENSYLLEEIDYE